MTFYSGLEDEGHFVPNIPNTQSPHNYAPNVGLESEGFNVPSFANTPQVQSSVFDKTWPGNPIPLVPYENPPAFQDSYATSNFCTQNTISHTKKMQTILFLFRRS